MTKPRVLTEATLSRAVKILTKNDSDLAAIVKRFGRPPLWGRETGFHTLVHIILEQQVSLASARAAYDRLVELASPLTPDRFLKLDDTSLKVAGFSRQKILYSRGVAQSLTNGHFNLPALESMHDEAVRMELMKHKGIGAWSSDIYLLMALRRPDVWPSGDLALAIAVQKTKQLAARPTQDELNKMSEQWRPWRAVAARVFWHYYLSELALKKKHRATSNLECGDPSTPARMPRRGPR